LKNLYESYLYQLSLKIYFFTHCIIAETLFYARNIPQKYQSTYLKIIEIVEDLIKNNYFNSHIDHKLEFLMCCRICNYTSKLENQIFDEINQSLSTEGLFLVDSINYYKDTRGKFDFYQAEHQNVLYLMACQKYSPHALWS